jgi:signal transduction histidine kinase
MQSVADREHVLEIAIDIFADDSLQISLRDSGVGFTSEVQNRLFAQGYTTRVEGSGQGLHYCSNVIREMGGEIWAESDGPGLGAVFIISIPRAVRRPQQLSASSEPRSDASSATESVNTSSYEKAEQYV